MTSGSNGLLLIGTSHVGKSTCANNIGSAIRCPVISTDMLGRHPGRPWTGVPDAVLEFYHRMSDDAIHWFLQVHHENMRPLIGAKIEAVRETGEGFILEGAALRPEYLGDWQIGEALAVCLHVEPNSLRERIRTGSNHSQQNDTIKVAIDKFTERSVRENEALAETAVRNKIEVVDVTDFKGADRLARELASRLVASPGL
ncbi:hypothetical protein [Mesorhizobium sp. B4-1-4]|uniref:hypothetical protein n=1 Tax=Mesorhizobium sp. B4-1-4 TaxID=2589888 RepID=UPI00116D85FE|nr:hypothetical protein [Mesorhizobium sp. B4-1-4]UCI32033.1 hypothetical protein FJW03_00770 [Mesorhizobium sp. B4-1-4]